MRLQTLSSADLRARGLTRRAIRAAVRRGELVHARRDRYVPATAGDAFIRAAEAGGRVDCVSLMAESGVFVLAGDRLHLQITRGKSRIPVPDTTVRHWRATRAADPDLAADVVEALAQAVRCQQPRAAIATLDSAWHRGVVDADGIARVFALLPARFGVLRAHLDPRAESGPETLARLIVRMLGHRPCLQVDIAGVGRVDLLVDGWLILECDSRAHHADLRQQLRDRRRDLAAAAQGYVTLRLLAEDLMYRPEKVVAALRGVLSSREHNSATTPDRRAPRAARSGFAQPLG